VKLVSVGAGGVVVVVVVEPVDVVEPVVVVEPMDVVEPVDAVELPPPPPPPQAVRTSASPTAPIAQNLLITNDAPTLKH
jgi:hypothetical protein